MKRVIYLIILLAGTYLVDHFAFGGKVYSETALTVNNLSVQADYTVRDFLRPLGK